MRTNAIVSERLWREARPLLWPWVLAVWASLASLYSSGDAGEATRTLALCGGVALLAALPFGVEFQQRTWPLLLSQPIPRSRIWSEKFLVLAMAGSLILLLNCLTWRWLADLNFWDLCCLGIALLATVTSTGYWIRRTGSTAAGIVSGVVSQAVVFGAIILTLRYCFIHYTLQAQVLLSEYKWVLFVCLTVYALSFLWLGRLFWNGKLLWLAVGLVAGALALEVGQVLAKLGREAGANPSETFLLILFMVCTMCSAGFWTLTARSTLGGMVFCVASQVSVAVVWSLIMLNLQKAFPTGLATNWTPDNLFTVSIGIPGLVYAGVFLYLGWRKFAGLELRESVAGEAIELGSRSGRGGWWTRWLVSQPRSEWLNLVRKELWLQKPVFIMAALFLVLFLAALALSQRWPEQGYNHLPLVIFWAYVPLTLLLSGSLPMGEEKSLGTAAWQLTLPVSVRRLWGVKFLIANGVGLGLGVVLPGLLAVWTLNPDILGRRSGAFEPQDWLGFALGAWLTVLVGFWAATRTANTVRAVVAAIIAAVAGIGCILLGNWGAQFVDDASGGLQVPWLTSIMTHYELSPNWVMGAASEVVGQAPLVAGIVAIALLLWQSYTQFRSTVLRKGVLLRHALSMVLLIAGTAFWVGDLGCSLSWMPRSAPVVELQEAFQALIRKQSTWTEGKATAITLTELGQAVPLSVATKRWLRNAKLSYEPERFRDGQPRTFPPDRGRSYVAVAVLVTIRFASGEEFVFGCMAPAQRK
jgi:hypothetical protein